MEYEENTTNIENNVFSCEVEDSKDDVDDSVEWYCPDDEESNEDCSSSEEVFSFETDHAALIANPDYNNLIKTLAILQIQRIKTIEDINRLENLKFKIRNNPGEYLKKLLDGDTSEIPARIVIRKVPVIDWSKYGKNYHPKEEESKKTRQPGERKTDEQCQKKDNGAHCSETVTVRGRVFDQTKPQTFNQLWTAEEQLRLEELLLEFPPERNENSRWRKIAEALGNRTTKQVCSRVQKYFKKLNKAGLPIPGHQLKTNTMLSTKKKPRRKVKVRDSASTFFPTQHLGAPQLLDNCDEDENKIKTPTLTLQLKTDIIKKVIEYKKKDSLQVPFSHPDVKCGVCGETPLVGTRWRCLACSSVNLCSDCVIGQLNAVPPLHSPLHPLEPVTNPNIAHWDPDYTPDSFQTTNYLDPNFVTSNVL